MAGNFTNQWNRQALTAKKVVNVTGYNYLYGTARSYTIATDITVPLNVNWNTPEYGNMYCGGLLIGTTTDNLPQTLRVILAGADSPTDFLVRPGDFLDVQAISIIGDADEDGELKDVKDIVAYMGQEAEGNLEPFYNPYYQTYYNFDCVAAWNLISGVNESLTEANFVKWLNDTQGFALPDVLSDYTYIPIYHNIDDDIYIGRVKCRLKINCLDANWRLSNNFLEINGIGDFYNCKGIQINQNNYFYESQNEGILFNGLKAIDFKYYSQCAGGIQLFESYNNSNVEIINLDFMQYELPWNILESFDISEMTLVKEFTNFVGLPDSVNYFSCYYFLSFRQFNYDLTNTVITSFYLNDSATYDNNNNIISGIEFVNTALLPDTISYLGLNGNFLRNVTTGYVKFPANLNTLALNSNDMVDFNPSCKLPINLNALYLYNNKLTTFNVGFGLPDYLFYVYLQNNNLSSITTYLPLYCTILSLSGNQFTSFNFGQYLNNNLSSLNMADNYGMTKFVCSVPLPTSLNNLQLQNNPISTFLPKGTNAPNTIYAYGMNMDVPDWDAMNPWALGLTAGAPGTKQFLAFANPGTIAASPTYSTLISKGYSVSA